MTDATFTFRLDEELKSAFADAAKSQDRTSAQLLRVLMREAVDRAQVDPDYDAWFRVKVQKALRKTEDPNVRLVGNDEVRVRFASRREAASRKASDR
jgi:hypothetical protein